MRASCYHHRHLADTLPARIRMRLINIQVRLGLIDPLSEAHTLPLSTLGRKLLIGMDPRMRGRKLTLPGYVLEEVRRPPPLSHPLLYHHPLICWGGFISWLSSQGTLWQLTYQTKSPICSLVSLH